MRLVILLVLLVSLPLVSAEFLAVTMDVSEQDVLVHDVELAFTGDLLSPEEGLPVTLEIVDDAWRSVARSRVTASLVSVSDQSDGSVSTQTSGQTRTTALVPVTENARLLIVRGPTGKGQVFDLRAASCGSDPLCEDCVRKYPEWCERAPASEPDRGVMIVIALNALLLATIVVVLMKRAKA